MTTAEPRKPILVMMSWRGGARLTRCLESIAESKHHFKRIVLSITATENSDDMRQAQAFQAEHPEVEVICTKRELPTMQHQAFWVTYLEQTGATESEWIFWLAYDDQVRKEGIDKIVDLHGNWPLDPHTCYLGPWAMRHESPDQLFDGPWDSPIEIWTSFPTLGPLRMPVLDWIHEQLLQPTYLQMSGAVAALKNFMDLRDSIPRKRGPMRIEMAIAACPGTGFVEEFSAPITTIFGRSNSDRASYGARARLEDINLLGRLFRYAHSQPHRGRQVLTLSSHLARLFCRMLRLDGPLREEWRIRAQIRP